MEHLDDLMRNQQTAKLFHDQKKLEKLRNAPETQQLFSMLRENTGGDLEQAANNAAHGDTAPLISAIQKLMKDPKGAELMEKMKQHLHH